MKYIFKRGEDSTRPTLLLLHGTGGNEFNLLSIAEKIDAKANVLSVRGNVLENGLPRFFKRIAEGVFDEEDLIYRTKELNQFLNETAEKHHFKRDQIIAIGYSNGANMAASLLFHIHNALKGAILLHPMVPRRGIDLPNLTGKSIFIGAGLNDPLCPVSESVDLQSLLERANGEVTIHWENNGHQLSETELLAASKWYDSISL